MPRTVNVNYITKEVKILLHDSETESLAAATAIAAAESAQEAKDVVVDNLQDSLDAIDAKTETEKTELDNYTDTKKTEISSFATEELQPYVSAAAASAQAADTTATALTTFLETKETLTAPAVDSTLSVSGAAADAKVTGTIVDELLEQNVFDILRMLPKTSRTGSINFEWLSDGSCHVYGSIPSVSTNTQLFGSPSSFPKGMKAGGRYFLNYKSASTKVGFWIYTYKNNDTSTLKSLIEAATAPTVFSIPSDVTGILIRIVCLGRYVGTAVDEIVKPEILPYELYAKTQSVNNWQNPSSLGISTADDIDKNCFVFVSSNSSVPSITDTPFVPCWLQTIKADEKNNLMMQIAYAYNYSETLIMAYRVKKAGTWGDWLHLFSGSINNYGVIPFNKYASCDEVDISGVYFVSSYEGVLNIPDFPLNQAGWLYTITTKTNASDFRVQFAYPYNPASANIQYRIKNNSGWTNWMDISSEAGTVTEIQQEISRDTYNNTYNITTNPQITTDSNGWLQPVDTNTADETGKTDMTGAIMSMLNSNGYCHLAPGIYYVSGNIDMPTGSTLEGCGRDTIIRLLNSVESGYIARVKEYSTIKNIRFSGGYADGDVSTPDIGGRKGIIYIGNRDGQEPSVTPSTGKNCHITNCWFENLDSGIYGHNAGGGLQEGLIVSDCYITLCKAGINLDYWTEYCKFTNVVVFKCYYACINNGGNNVFTSCTFHGTVGFLIDNTNGQSPNNAHGSVIGCVFNHIDNWNRPQTLGGGNAIEVRNITNGFIFTGCQIWYGKIFIQDSIGVVVSDSLMLGGAVNNITVTGEYPAFFNNNIFKNAPDLT